VLKARETIYTATPVDRVECSDGSVQYRMGCWQDPAAGYVGFIRFWGAPTLDALVDQVFEWIDVQRC
jgi:hypothetical protein